MTASFEEDLRLIPLGAKLGHQRRFLDVFTLMPLALGFDKEHHGPSQRANLARPTR